MFTCGLCGGGLIADSSGGRRRDVFDADSLPRPGEVVVRLSEPYRSYVCHRRRQMNGCANGLRIRVEEVDEAVLSAIEEHALTAQAIEQVIQLSERDDVAEQRERIEKEAIDIAGRLRRLLEVVESGGDAASVLHRIRDLEARQKTIREEIAGLRPVPRLAPNVVESRLAEWRRLLRGSRTQGRAVLQRVIRGRIVFTPMEDGGYDFSAESRFDKLFAGVVVQWPKGDTGADLRRDAGKGGVGLIGTEDTLEGDYETLLERVQNRQKSSAKKDADPGAQKPKKAWRPWWDSNPRSPP